MNPRLELACTRLIIGLVMAYSGYRLIIYLLA